jgi:hypothetical protein
VKTNCFSCLCTVRTSAVISLLLLSAAVNAAPPSIGNQPKDKTVILYQQAALGVIASGTAPLAYQWRKDPVIVVQPDGKN